MARTYWIDLFTIETWKEFLDHGGDVSGFSEKRQGAQEPVVQLGVEDREFGAVGGEDVAVGALDPADQPGQA